MKIKKAFRLSDYLLEKADSYYDRLKLIILSLITEVSSSSAITSVPRHTND